MTVTGHILVQLQASSLQLCRKVGSFAGIFYEFCLDFESIILQISSEGLLRNVDFLVVNFLECRFLKLQEAAIKQKVFCSIAIIQRSVLQLTIPNLVARPLKKAVVDFIFSVVAGLQSSALLGKKLPCGQFSRISVLKCTSRSLLPKVLYCS